MKQILIVDDDIYIGNMLEEVLTKEGYLVLRAYSGTEALLVLTSAAPDLVLLDLMLPGASDYVTKPFEMKELLARITAALRKRQPGAGGVLSFEGLRLDTLTHVVSLPAQDTPEKISGEIRLTRTEFAILKMLMLHPAQIIAKSTLLERISEDTPDCTEHSLKTHISNLRKKLRDIGGREYIEAVWGIGFRLIPEKS